MGSFEQITSRLAVVGFCLAITGHAVAAGVPVDKATEAQKKEAQGQFATGLEKSQAGDHAAALASFKASFEVVASPNARLMVVRELTALGRYVEAYEEALATEKLAHDAVAIDKKYADSERSAHDEGLELAKKLGFVKLSSGQPGELTVGGKPVEAGKAFPVMPGEVEVSFKDASGKVETKKVTVSAGQEQAVDLTPATTAPVETPKEPASKSVHPFDMGTGQRITAGVFLGVGAVGMGLFAGFGLANQARYSDLEERCATTGCTQDEIDEGKTFQTGANVSVIVGAIGLAAGAGLLIPTFFAGGDDAKADEKKAAVRLEGVRFGLGSVGLNGSFQ